MNLSKKKRFVYNPVINKNEQSNNNKKDIRQPAFPDDFNEFVSQPSKKIRLSDEKTGKPKEDVKRNDNVDSLIENIDLMDDDFDFTEIDQIEIAASQQVMKKSNEVEAVNLLDNDPQENECKISIPTKRSANKQENSNTLSLKIPKRKSVLPATNDSHVFTSPLQSRALNKNDAPDQLTKSKDLSFNKITVRSDTNSAELKNAKEELNDYKSKLKESERKFHSKDGEIKILRESLKKNSEQERVSKEKIFRLENDLKTQQSEKESSLVREVERLKTKLEFAEREMTVAIEKQKKANPVVKKSPKVLTPVKNSTGSGFFVTKSAGYSKSENQLPDSRSCDMKTQKKHQPQFLKQLFRKSTKHFSVPKEIVYNISKQVYSLKKEQAEYTCCHHEVKSIDDFSLGKKLFSDTVQKSLELLESEAFFVLDFICLITKHLTRLCILLSKPVVDNVSLPNLKLKAESSEANVTVCLLCEEMYQNGVNSLVILHESANLFVILKMYLLLSLSYLQGRKMNMGTCDNTVNKVEVAGRPFKPTVRDVLVDHMKNFSLQSKNMFRESDLEKGVQLWTTLDQIKQISSSSSSVIDEQLFLFYSALISSHNVVPQNSVVQLLKSEETLSKYLASAKLERILQATQLLQNGVSLRNINEVVCSNSDKCPLLIIYNAIISLEVETCPLLLQVFEKLVCFMSSFIAQNQSVAFQALLEGDCQCCHEVIECMITILFDEFKYLQHKVFSTLQPELSQSDKDRLLIYRQGLSLLCVLCSHDKALAEKRSAVEWNYVYLLVGSVKMFRKIPSVNESEVLALEDLLDLDQYIDLGDDSPS